MLWFSYGVAIGNAALIVTNTVAIVVSIGTMAVVMRYRPASGGRGEVASEPPAR